MNRSTPQDAERLVSLLHGLRRVVIALSGGVDSSVVAAACQRAELDYVCALTAHSPSVPGWQLQTAIRIANEIGVEHHVVRTDELDRSDYQVNDSNRCFYCKDTLYAAISQFIAELSFSGEVTVVSGTNRDDLGDHRPGIAAGERWRVVAPLAETGCSKSKVRELARYFGLSNHELPASPCLASRIAYGVEVTGARLARIVQSEDWLRSRGLPDCRVRLHPDGLARIEVKRESVESILKLDAHGELTRRFREFGFKFVTVDLEGLQSGKMNRVLVPLELPVKVRNNEAEQE